MENKILVTGESGFLGKLVVQSLKENGYNINSLNSLEKKRVDISVPFEIQASANFETIIHAAGKAHKTPRTKKEEQAFWEVNLEGTKNLSLALTKTGNVPENFVFISTVSIYGKDEGQNITEENALNGITAYAKSKIAAEKWLIQWAAENKVKLLILRLPLIAGPNPPGNLGAMINGIKAGRYLRIGKGDAKKSMVLASDVSAIIAKSIGTAGVYNLTDGYHPTFCELEKIISFQLGRKAPRSIPLPLAKLVGKAGDLLGNKFPINSSRLSKITNTLTFSDEKARKELGWNPHSVLAEFKIA